MPTPPSPAAPPLALSDSVCPLRERRATATQIG